MTLPRAMERRACRVCGTLALFPYLDLGLQPLANAIRDPSVPLREEFRAPLVVNACPRCKLSQLSHVVPKELLYAGYPFRSGTSPAWRAHCEALAGEYGRAGLYMVDIAANDGTLLRAFRAHGADVHGVEPAANTVPPDLLPVVHTTFWTAALAQREFARRVDLLTAQNVVGHVDDVHDFMAGVAVALAEHGLALIEVPYVQRLFDALAFDTVYHEHLSYWSVTAFQMLAEAHGLVLRDVEELPVHGGSIRVVLGRSGTPTPAVKAYLDTEHHDLRRQTYLNVSARVSRRIAEIEDALAERAFVGFGAAAKGTVLLNCLDCRALPRVVYDETAAKHGKCVPGTMVRIAAPPPRWAHVTHPMVLYPWNWVREIVPRLRAAGYAAPIFVPNPRPQWLV